MYFPDQLSSSIPSESASVFSNSTFEAILDQDPVKEAMEVLLVKKAEDDPAPVELTVNKYLLASRSPFFYTLFFGPFFEERTSNRFQLVEPKLAALKTMFKLLDRLEEGLLNRNNVADLLALSKQYIVPFVCNKCLQYLSTGDDDIFLKIKIADKFELPEFEEKCFGTLKRLCSSTKCPNNIDSCLDNNRVVRFKMIKEEVDLSGHHLRHFIFQSSQNQRDYKALSERVKLKMLYKIVGL